MVSTRLVAPSMPLLIFVSRISVSTFQVTSRDASLMAFGPCPVLDPALERACGE